MFGFLFLFDSFHHPVKFAANAFQLTLRLFLLLNVHLRQGFSESPAGSMHEGKRHLQFASEGKGSRLSSYSLLLRFQKQFRLGEDAVADHVRAVPPGSIKLRGLPCVAMVLDESGGHACAVVHIDSRHRHQILHRQLRAESAFAHLLLDGFRQQFDQRQAPRHPTHATVEAACKFVERASETSLHFHQQPTLFERAFRWTESQRPGKHQRFGFAQGPDHGFDRIPAELFQRSDALMSVYHQVALAVVCGNDHDDGSLLAAVSQRGQQPALSVRFADPQMLPSPVQLVKLQLHHSLLGVQYRWNRYWSFGRKGEVGWEVLWSQADMSGTGLSWCG